MTDGNGAAKPRLRRFAAGACITMATMVPRPGHAQTFEFDVRRVVVDEGSSGRIGASADRIPQGFGVAGRYVFARPVFVEVALSTGAEDRFSAVCGGFIVDPATQCIPEIVRYTGGLLAIFVGWPGRLQLGSDWVIGLRPRLGIAFPWTAESGRETGRSYEESASGLAAGLSAEVSRALPWFGLSVVASGGIDVIDLFAIGECLDCRREFGRDLRQIAYGIGVRWRP